MHGHHDRNEGVNPEHESKGGRRDDAHELEIHLADQRPGVRSGGKRTEDRELLAQFRPLLLSQGHEGLRRPLRMADRMFQHHIRGSEYFSKACFGLNPHRLFPSHTSYPDLQR